MTVPSPVSSLLSVLLLLVKGVEGPLWVDDAEDIFDSEVDTFSLSLSWAEGQADGEGIFSLPLSEVFD